MASDACTTVANCQYCAGQIREPLHQKQLSLCPAARLLELLVIDITGSLTKTKSGNQPLIIFADQYTKEEDAVLDTTVAFTSGATVLVDD